MEKKSGNTLAYLFWAAVAVALVALCLRQISWQEFSLALQQCRWGYVLLAMALGVACAPVRALRWRMLLLPLDRRTSPLSTLNAYNIGMAVNLVLPRVGGLVRMGYAAKDASRSEDGHRNLTADQALGTIVAERAWDALFLVVLTGVAVALSRDRFGAFLEGTLGSAAWGKLGWWLGGAVLLVGAAVLALWLLRGRSAAWAKAWGFVTGMVKGLGSFRKMDKGWLFLLYTLLLWTLYWATSASIVWALQDIPLFAGLGLSDALLISIAGTLSTLIPVPGGFGAYHSLVGLALGSLWGIPAAAGLVYATLNHESQVLVQALLGLGSYIHENFLRRK